MPLFVGISDLDEDDRIRVIGETAVNQRQITGFFVDDATTADRYIAKLKAQFPSIRITFNGPGPSANTHLVKVEPPLV